MQILRITTAQNIDIDYEVAGLGPRILAYLLDALIFISVYLLAFFSGFVSSGLETLTLIFFVGFSLAYVFYDPVCEIFFNGQSIGKRVMKIKVISLDGSRPTIGQYLLRGLFRMIDFTFTMNLGALLCVAVTDKRQRIGDLVAGTSVVRTEPKTGLHHVAFMPPPPDYKVVFPEAANLSDNDIAIVHEVLGNFGRSSNYPLLESTARRIKEHLGIKETKQKDDEQFLESILKDYNYLQIYEEEPA